MKILLTNCNKNVSAWLISESLYSINPLTICLSKPLVYFYCKQKKLGYLVWWKRDNQWAFKIFDKNKIKVRDFRREALGILKYNYYLTS
jgi:hypothetical protein